MEINNLQGKSAYTNTSNGALPVDNNLLRDQSLETSRADVNTEDTRAAQSAFEVDITQQAKDIQAAQSNEKPVETQAQAPEDLSNQDITQTQERRQIVDIVA